MDFSGATLEAPKIPDIIDSRIQNPLGQGKVPFKLYLQKDRENKIITAPLMVYIPGMFSSYDNVTVMTVLKSAVNSGYHTLALPNVWNIDFIDSRTTFMPGNFIKEAESVIGIIHSIKNTYIGREHISSGILIGESYGAFLSSVVVAMDSRSSQAMFDNGVMLIHPPLNILDGLHRIDGILQANSDDLFNIKIRDFITTALAFMAGKRRE